MTTKVPTPPVLPQPRGGAVDASYITQLVRALEISLNNLHDIGALRGGTLFLKRLPVTGSQLRAGEVFDDGGTLKIVRDNIGYAPTLSMTARVGSVTVTVA